MHRPVGLVDLEGARKVSLQDTRVHQEDSLMACVQGLVIAVREVSPGLFNCSPRPATVPFRGETFFHFKGAAECIPDVNDGRFPAIEGPDKAAGNKFIA